MFQQNYTQLPSAFFSPVNAEPMHNAKLVAVNESLLSQLNLMATHHDLLGWLQGSALAEGMQPIAQKYCGHQFGFFNDALGDGRGLLLGQWQAQNGKRWDFHLKGSGRTPYSRRGDGRAVLRSTIREFLASEALFGLGISTTRSLAMATSPEQVQRETFEPRATLIRVASTHIRFGHFEWAALQGQSTFNALLDFVFEHVYPQHAGTPDAVFNLLKEIVSKTAQMIAKWQAVGFCHGVMNTDNFSICGETFDYGPFGFMDRCSINHICNHSDTQGRYAYNEQPKIGLWNCQVLARTFAPILSAQQIDEAVNVYVEQYNHHYLAAMLDKLGLSFAHDVTQQKQDRAMVGDLLVMLDSQAVDFTYFFRALRWLDSDASLEWPLFELFADSAAFEGWLRVFEKRRALDNTAQVDWVNKVVANNPSIVLRNYLAQEIIEQVSQGDYAVMAQWLDVLHHPFAEHPQYARYQVPPAEAQKNTRLSCSS